jgi:hypothetical protein
MRPRYFAPRELAVLEGALRGSPVPDRVRFFEDCLRLRRRERHLWGDTPLAQLFTEEGEKHMLRIRAILQQVGYRLSVVTCGLWAVAGEGLPWWDWGRREVGRGFTFCVVWGCCRFQIRNAVRLAVKRRRGRVDPITLFTQYDNDHDGALTYTEMQRMISAMNLGFSAGDIADVVRFADQNSDGRVDFEEYLSTFDLQPSDVSGRAVV